MDPSSNNNVSMFSQPGVFSQPFASPFYPPFPTGVPGGQAGFGGGNFWSSWGAAIAISLILVLLLVIGIFVYLWMTSGDDDCDEESGGEIFTEQPQQPQHAIAQAGGSGEFIQRRPQQRPIAAAAVRPSIRRQQPQVAEPPRISHGAPPMPSTGSSRPTEGWD